MRRVSLAIAGCLLAAWPAAGQVVDRGGVPYRSWDVDAGFGFHNMTEVDGGAGHGESDGEDWNGSWAGTVDVGRYWSPHLKTEVGLTFLQQITTLEYETVEVDGLRGTAYTYNDVRQAQVSLAATWQFLENTFAHPYLSTGVRVGILDIESERNPWASVWAGGTYRQVPVPETRGNRVDLRVRPYVAVGSKSYFSERTFVRPELTLGFNAQGMSQLGARLAFGVDF